MGKAILSTIIIALSLVALVSMPTTTGRGPLGVWRDVNPSAYISPSANPQLNSVYMFSTLEGWAVGDSRPTTDLQNGLPAVFHYDGSTWNIVPVPRFPDLTVGPTPTAYNLTSVSFGPPGNPISRSDGWAVGFNNIVGGAAPNAPVSAALHWDGTTWRIQNGGFLGADAGPLFSVFMVSSTDAWAVGQDQAGDAGVFWHWTGVPGLGGGWNLPQTHFTCVAPLPVVPAPYCGIFSVFMVSSTEGWAVGAGGLIFHYFGGSWSSFTSPVGTALRSVYMLSPTEGWATGDYGVIIHYLAGTWSGPVSPGTTLNNLYSVFMVSSTEGWAFGAKSTILHYVGGTWTALPSNTVPTDPVAMMNLTSGYFNAANDGWVVGTDGVVLHYDGTIYGTLTSPTINNFTSISFGPPNAPINPNDGWAVGNSSLTTTEPTIIHWNGFMWTKGIAIGTTNNLYSVFMINSGDVWAVGGGTHATASCTYSLCPNILHYTGGSWNSVTPPGGSYVLKSVFMLSPGEGWAVGEQCSQPQTGCAAPPGPNGVILHWQVSGGVGTWGIFPGPASTTPLPPLNSVFMVSPTEGWAVGDYATILHYTVSGGVGTWNLVTVSGTPTLFPNANLTSIYMLSPTSGWAVGGCWFSAAAICTNPLVNPASPVGPIIIYWDGTKWEPVAAPTIPGGITPGNSFGLQKGHANAILKSVFFTNPNDGWAVGFPGILVAMILHWDGISWNHISLSPALLGQIPPILTSVYMTSATNGWVVGSSPDFTGDCSTYPYFSPGPPPPPLPGGGAVGCLNGRYGYKTPLSTVLRFSPFGSVLSTTSTIVSVSTQSMTIIPTTSQNTTAIAPSTVTVSIKAVDNNGNPVPGATVSLSPSGQRGTTNSQGIVTFAVPPGPYTATFTKNANQWTLQFTATSNGQTFNTTSPGAGIPGFPVESIIVGLSIGVLMLMVIRLRRRRK